MRLVRLSAAIGAALVAAVLAAHFVSQTERWQVSIASDQNMALLTLSADAPVQGWTRRGFARLIVKCQGGVRQIAVGSGLPIEVEPRPTRSVSLQFDGEPPQLVQWVLGGDRETLIQPEPDVQATARKLATTRRLDVSFVPLRSEPATARFSTGGFSRVRDAVGQCHSNGNGGASDK